MSDNVEIFPKTYNFRTVEDLCTSAAHTLAQRQVLNVLVLYEYADPEELESTCSALGILNLNTESGEGMTNSNIVYLLERLKLAMLTGEL